MRSIVALVLLLLPCRAAGQAPIFIPPGTWIHDAIETLVTAGVAPPASDPALAPLTYRHARRAFLHAIVEGEARNLDDVVRLARGFADRLAEEADSVARLSLLEVSAGWHHAVGEARGGDGYFVGEDWTGARPVDAARTPAFSAAAAGRLGDRFAWQVEAGRLAGEWFVPAASAAVALGPFDVWAGRRRLHYGVGRSGAIVLGSGLHTPFGLAHRTHDAFDGVGVHVREPFAFPGPLRILGPIRIEVVGGPLERSGRIDAPWVVFGRVTGAPFSDRFMLGVNRGAVFGGEGNPITARRLLGLVAGLHGGDRGEFENQVFSVVASYRPPLGILPVEVYGEYGMDDTAGAISDVPAWVAGLRTGPLPGLSALSLALEHTRYAVSCCGNTIWYRSIFFRGSWQEEGRLFAHPLGGHGREWLAHASVAAPARGVHGRLDIFERRRGHENLFAPERQGLSRGVSAAVDYRAAQGLWLRSAVEVERGSGWQLERIAALLAWSPPLR